MLHILPHRAATFPTSKDGFGYLSFQCGSNYSLERDILYQSQFRGIFNQGYTVVIIRTKSWTNLLKKEQVNLTKIFYGI